MAYLNEAVDYYIVGSPFTKEKLQRAGILENGIHAFGIPFSKEFYNKKLSKNSEFVILVMSGSMELSQIFMFAWGCNWRVQS